MGVGAGYLPFTFEWDLKYISRVSFLKDLRIIWLTVKKVFGKSETAEELDVTLDYGDYLLRAGNTKKEIDRVLEQIRSVKKPRRVQNGIIFNSK